MGCDGSGKKSAKPLLTGLTEWPTSPSAATDWALATVRRLCYLLRSTPEWGAIQGKSAGRPVNSGGLGVFASFFDR